ncbi:nitric oxide reductase activation protein NorD [uncultured Halomonas sp.]|uniref:nitric oxide reductase activation protein NorD n=1 Tax=Halomonas mongoliensis TaxID=321265 RepID=UPI00262193C4|nr:VWA domain-containing protein [uncultured Halomonas sp.]
MLHFLEVEEFVGRHWHRWASGAASYRRYPEAAVALEELRHVLGVFFRASGGESGLEVAAIVARSSAHRLSLRQRLGFDDEAIDQARRDEESLLLPPTLDFFPEARLNRDLYFWLTAFLAVSRHPGLHADPLQNDLARLREAMRATEAALERFPGLAGRYRDLCGALLAVRPVRRKLPPMEQALEATLRALLGDDSPLEGWAASMAAAVADPDASLEAFQAPRGYRPPLPVPLWGQVVYLGVGHGREESDEDPHDGETNSAQQASEGKRKAERRRQDQSERDDPLIANRFEKMLSWTEMVNLNRLVEDNEDEEAKRAAEQIEEIVISPHKQRAATRLKVDLDLPPDEALGERLRGKRLYPEWNYRKQCYLPDHCQVHTDLQSEEGEQWEPDDATRRRIRRVRREFEALRPRREILRGQLDGSELDMDAVIRSRCDLAATGEASDRLYMSAREQARDLAVDILVDVSLSTDAWLEDRRVLDVEKEALMVLGHGLAGCGDDYAIHCFTSHRRQKVWVNTLKTFEESMSERVARRISALKPGHYTRMGPAIRHVTGELAKRPNRHRLLLVITDGKPNDTDYYEGRYGIEDTRKAVLEARQQEVRVFGVTVDREAHQYVSHLFGRGSYAIVNRPEHLALALPGIYRQIIGH